MGRALQGLPSTRIQGVYWTTWRADKAIQNVSTNYNVIYMFHVYSAAGSGVLAWSDGAPASSANIDTVRARGQRVMLGIGGSGGALTTLSQPIADDVIQSVKDINVNLGGTPALPAIDGIDWNTFEFGGTKTPTARAYYVYMSQALKTYFGSQFIISSAPAGNYDNMTLVGDTDAVLCKQLFDNGVADYTAPQFYGGPGYTSSVITEISQWWIDNVCGGDEKKYVVGFGTGNIDGVTISDATISSAWATLKGNNSQIRGAFNWDQETATTFNTNIGSSIRDGVLIDGGPDTTPPPAPSVTPASGSYTTVQAVTMANSEPGVAIRYTVGSGATIPADPTPASTLYTGSFTIRDSQVIKVAAFDAALNRSPIVQRAYVMSVPGPAKIATFTHVFSSFAGWTALTPGSSVSSGKLTLPASSNPYVTVRSNEVFDLTSSSAYIDVTTIPNAGAGSTEGQFWVQYDDDNTLLMSFNAGQILTRIREGGVNSDAAYAYPGGTRPRYIRIAESGGNIVFSSSNNAASWTTLRTVAHTMATELGAAYIMLAAGTWEGELNPGSFVIETVNLIGAGAGGNKTATLVDDFSTFDTAKWTRVNATSSDVTVTSNRLVVTPNGDYPRARSVARYDLTSSSLMFELYQKLNDTTVSPHDTLQAEVGVVYSGSTYAAFKFEQGKINCSLRVNDVYDPPLNAPYWVTYDATKKFYRFVESGNDLLWQRSTTGSGPWETIRTKSGHNIGSFLADVTVEVHGGWWNATAPSSPGTFILEGFNVSSSAAIAHTGSVSLSAQTNLFVRVAERHFGLIDLSAQSNLVITTGVVYIGQIAFEALGDLTVDAITRGIHWRLRGTSEKTDVLPYFSFPFVRGVDNKVETVEPDTQEHVMTRVNTIAHYPLGYREDKSFGIPYPEFANAPIDADNIADHIGRQVPEADIEAEEYADAVSQAHRHVRLEIDS